MTNSLKGLNVLVTGGAGFLGSNLCERLVTEGAEVVCVDNLTTGRRRNIEHLCKYDCFQFIEADVRESLDLDVGWIFNLACPASPHAYQADPVSTTMTSVLGAYNLLGLANKKQARIMQASTSEVYGDPSEHPQTEKYWGHVNPIGPRSCYDEGKRCAETLFFDHHKTIGTDIRVARIFNTYGPHMLKDDGRVVSNFIVEALQNIDLTVYGDGLHTRSFCYVDDLIEGFIRLMFSKDIDPGPYNLGNPKELTIIEFAKRIIDLTGSKSKIAYLEEPVDDPHYRCPDIEKAGNVLGWRPVVDLEFGLRKTIAYFEKLLSEQRSISV